MVVSQTTTPQGGGMEGTQGQTTPLQGGGKLAPLLTTGCRFVWVRWVVQRRQGDARPPPQGGGKLAPLLTYGGLPCPHEFGEYAMFYGLNRSFDDKERSPAVSRGASLPPPWGGLAPASALGLGCGLFVKIKQEKWYQS